MNDVYLLIGGNLGERFATLKKTTELIEQYAGRIVARSAIYETSAWGLEDQPAFLNEVVMIDTQLPPPALLQKLLTIEEMLGRKRLEKYGPRIIDIDILLYGNEVVNEPHLKIPHPFLPDRRFALTPLCEIAPTLKHPVLHKTIAELLDGCTDTLAVEKIFPQ
jgi:2-amino-4-hydroxy-6-hydroxymethyldihydropteridine diphosphokinase